MRRDAAEQRRRPTRVALLLSLLLLMTESRADISDLARLMNERPKEASRLGYCDFDDSCDWAWNTTDGVFNVTSAPLARASAPITDASRKPDGKFLWMTGAKEGQLQSSVITRTGSNCYMQVALHQVEMKQGNISLIIETYNKSTLAEDREGNNNATWEVATFNLRGMSQNFIIILEIKAPFENSSIAIDNISLVNCFPGARTVMDGDCNTSFRCNDSSCLRRDYVCDFYRDCKTGEDETEYCDKMPEEARCNFENPENRWCGWSNKKDTQFQWTLQQGMPDERMGPSHDHTYRNVSGTYAYVDLTGNSLGSQAILNSPTFNPTPPYHNSQSLYRNSCKVRFYYYQSGLQSSGLSLVLIQLRPQNLVKEIWWLTDRSNGDTWTSKVVDLPKNIQYKYYLQFVVSKSFSKAYVAIDDISLSPECFGIGVPPDIVGSFDYYNQKIPPWDNKPPKHIDFTNETVIQISTCGQTGRFGPTPEQCSGFYNGTQVEVLSDISKSDDANDAVLRNKGIQRWTAPAGGHYTLVAKGARGGAGALARQSNAYGAMVHGVIELKKGQHIYFMVGQPGSDACPKILGSKNSTCQQSGDPHSVLEHSDMIREVKNIEIKDGGGGGGGATYIFTIDKQGKQHPLLVAGGGGGLGPTKFQDDGIPYGKGLIMYHRNATHGISHKSNSGAGGGWLKSATNDSNHVSYGMALSEGGIGGLGCSSNQLGYGDGGFGGGGGGCLSGGGGGGYSGGDTGHADSGNGEGGYSYASPKLMFVAAVEKVNPGPGEAIIIPAIAGCGCNFRCIVIDEHLTDTRCLCPAAWVVDQDGKSCIKIPESDDGYRQKIMIVLIFVSIGSILALSFLCFLLYNKYQTRKALLRRRQVMFGNGTELTSLRVVSDSMMTELNPNYEFEGNLYSFKDLDQIPRESITLVKPLGQGAFGEVFQGIYKINQSEEHPVAVKTLPSRSTSQAEADFMMEALIMSKFRHPNIVQFIGVSFDKHPRYIILELLAGGDLKNFLREERPRPDRPTMLTMVNLINCAYDVAKGCKYMEDARFIHRDIAARNCLLTCKGPGRVVKIADFGMARDIYRSDYYRKGGKAMLPIKWMPPESFLDGIFTTKTDVWAFGVLLWEIMSFGYMPYTGCANREVMSMVTSGGRLERPAGCPDPIYGIMTRCWHPHPEERPSFATIVERIGYCLQDPDVINHPTPNYDLLPVCDREITIMRPDPETECINVHTDLDGCGYMQPRINAYPTRCRIGPVPGIVYASLRHASEDRENCNNLPDESPSVPVDSPPHEPHYHKHNSAPEDRDNDDCDNRDCNRQPDEDESNANLPVSSARQPSTDDVDNNVNNAVESKMQPGGQNGNGESTRTTDTNSDSLFIPSYGTPPDTISSSPNTRTSSPNRTITGGDNGTNNGNGSPSNVNGIIRKNALKAALSLDPSALCRGTIPYEKIAFSPPKPKLSNPGSTELRKDSLSRELPREEECSC